MHFVVVACRNIYNSTGCKNCCLFKQCFSKVELRATFAAHPALLGNIALQSEVTPSRLSRWRVKPRQVWQLGQLTLSFTGEITWLNYSKHIPKKQNRKPCRSSKTWIYTTWPNIQSSCLYLPKSKCRNYKLYSSNSL